MAIAIKNTMRFRTVNLPRILTDVAEEMIKSGKYGYRNLPDNICELLS